MKLTIAVVGALLVVMFAFDIWTLAMRGYNTTISWTIYEMAKGWPAIPFVFGFFAGHLFFPQKPTADGRNP